MIRVPSCIRTASVRARAGMTLLEATISMALFGVAAGMAMEFMIASRDLSSLSSAQDDVTLDASRILAEISQDLALSGWYVPPPVGQQEGILSPGDTFAQDRTRQYYPNVIQQALSSSRTEGLSSAFLHMQRAPALDVPVLHYGLFGDIADATTNFSNINPDDIRPILNATTSPAGLQATMLATWNADRQTYFDSWYARSQELIFLRQITELGWQADPTRQQRPTEMFGTIAEFENALHPKAMAPGHQVEWMSCWREIRVGGPGTPITGYELRPEYDTDGDGRTDQPYGVALRSGRFFIDLDGVIQFERMWEGMDQPDYSPPPPPPAAFTPATPPNRLREYLYAVVPSRTGFGRLVRAYRSDTLAATTAAIGIEPGQRISSSLTSAMIIDRVLSDDVVRITFDTARTDPTLDVFEVRVRLYLAQAQVTNPAVVIRRLVESIVLMRAKSSETDRAYDKGVAARFMGFDH